MSSAPQATRFIPRRRTIAGTPRVGEDSPPVRWPNYLSMMFVTSVYAGALTPAVRWLTGAGSLPPGDSDIGSTLTQVYALCVVTLWAVRNARAMRVVLPAVAPYLAIVALCFASIAWSGYPYNSLRRSVTLTVCIFYGLYLHDRLGLDGMIRMFMRTALLLAVLSLVAYVAVPNVGHDAAEGYTGALRGVFAAKNTAGMAMLLAIACGLHLGSLPGANRSRAIGSLSLAFLTLALTKSATSLLIAMIVLGLGSRLWLRSPKGRLCWNAAVSALLVAIVCTALFWPDQVFPLLGRDASLTGRVPLWQESLKLIWQRPLLGYGYSGFWNVDSRTVQYLWQVIGWNAPNGHDGYIDILLQIGVVGLLLYLFVWGIIIVRALKQVSYGTLPEAAWMLLLMTVNVLLNIDEGPLPYPDEFTLFVAVCLLVLSKAKATGKQEGSTAPRLATRPSVAALTRAARAASGPWDRPLMGSAEGATIHAPANPAA